MRMRQAILPFFSGSQMTISASEPVNQCAFARIQPKDLRGIRAHICHELIRCDLSGAHAVRPQDWHAVLDSGQAVWDLREIIFSQFFSGDGNLASFVDNRLASVVKEWAMIRPMSAHALMTDLPTTRALSFSVRIGRGQIHFAPSGRRRLIDCKKIDTAGRSRPSL